MAEKSIFLKEFDIPDNSSHDGTAPSMWGIYRGGGKKHIFFCKVCVMNINVFFPRWCKILKKEYGSNTVLSGIFKCPSCIKSDFVEIGE